MDLGLVSGICIIIFVAGIVFWLPVIIFFPVIKSLAERISGKSNAHQINTLKDQVRMLEQEVSDLRMKQIAMEDTHKFDQQLTKPKNS